MRELKFRAWHKRHGMIPSEEYFTVEEAVNGDLTFFGSPAKDYDSCDFVFMQFTGLKDIHGREIYEGDIIEWSLWPENEEGLKRIQDVVMFSSGAFATAKRHTLLFGIEPYRRKEIIGNIHENPELVP